MSFQKSPGYRSVIRVSFVRGTVNSRQTCQLHPEHHKARKRVIDNMNDDIRGTMRGFEGFESMGRFEQFLRAPEFEQRMKKSQEVIKRAEDNLIVSFVTQHDEDS